MLRIKRVIFIVCTLIAFSLGALPAPVAACGGFFCQNTPINQTAERIIFAVNRAKGSVTAVVGINYTGDAAAFSWVVPVPTPPTLDVAETASLDALGAATNMRFIPPSMNGTGCPSRGMPLSSSGSGIVIDSASDGYLKTGQVGPYDYAIIKNTRTDEMIGWLRDNGYRITPEMEPLIIQYVRENMYFLAMRLQRDKAVSAIKPVVMTYNDQRPMIPIRLTAVAAVPNMQIVTWLLGDGQYVPDNYANPTIDFSRMRNGFQPINENGVVNQSLLSYDAERAFIQAKFGGKAFVTEYAQPTAKLGLDISKLDPVVSGLFKQYRYVTRLRAQMSPNQMTLDPTFALDMTASDVSNVVYLADYVDGKTFYGC